MTRKVPGCFQHVVTLILAMSLTVGAELGDYTFYLKGYTDPRISYYASNDPSAGSGGWVTGLQDGGAAKCQPGGLRIMFWKGEGFTFAWTGTQASVLFAQAFQGTTGQLELDGTVIQSFDTSGSVDIINTNPTCTFINSTTGVLPLGQHVLNVTKTGSSSPSYLFVHSLEYIGDTPPVVQSGTTTSASTSSSNTISPPSLPKKSASGAVIGGAIGGVILAIVLGIVLILWCRRRRYHPHQKYDRTGRPVLDDQNQLQPDQGDTFNKPFTPFVEEGEVLAPFDTPPQPPNAEEIARAEKVQRFRASLPHPQASTSSVPLPTPPPQPEVGDVDPYELPPPTQNRNELEVARAHKLQQMSGQPSSGPGPSTSSKEAANPLPSRALPQAPAPAPAPPTSAPAPPNPPASPGVAPAVPPLELIESLMELNVPNEEIAAVVRRMAAREGPAQRMPWDDDLPPSYDPQDRQRT